MTELNEDTLDAADAIDAEEQMAEAIQNSSALVSFHKLTPLQIYEPGNINNLLSAISKEVANFKADVTTKKGRDEVASLAYKVSRSKTFLDDAGKKLGDDARKTVELINAERKKVRDSLDKLRDDIRKPLDQWEASEALRVNKHKAQITFIRDLANKCAIGWKNLSIEELEKNLSFVQTHDHNFEEFAGEASGALEDAIKRINESLGNKRDFETQRLEIERLQKEAADRKAKDDEEAAKKEEQRLASEAAKKKEADALKEKELEAQREENEALKKKQADADAEIARLKKIADDKAAADKKAADEKAAEEKREASKRHVTKILKAAAAALNEEIGGLGPVESLAIITAIAEGKVPNVSIKY